MSRPCWACRWLNGCYLCRGGACGCDNPVHLQPADDTSTVLQTEARTGMRNNNIDQEVGIMGRRNKDNEGAVAVLENPADGDYTTPDDAPEEAQTEATVEAEAVEGDAQPAEPAADAEPAKERKGRGDLEAQVKEVTDAFVTGELALADGEFLTPHRIGKEIANRYGSKPSTGAVQSAIKRWEDCGFAVANEKPYAFSDYTEAGRSEGLSALKAAAAQRRKDAKAAEKAAAAPAAEGDA